MVGCGGGRQADRQSVSQRRNASARQLSAQAFFFFNLCEVTDERCALGKKRKKKRKRHKICLPRWSGEGGGEKGREGKGGGVEADGVRWEPGAARGSDSSSAVSRGNQTGLLLCGSLFPQSTRQRPALATRPFSPGSSADPRLAGLRADQPVSWKSKGIAVS